MRRIRGSAHDKKEFSPSTAPLPDISMELALTLPRSLPSASITTSSPSTLRDTENRATVIGA